VKPFRGKRRGPQSLPVGFNPSTVCRARRRIRKGRGAHARIGDGCTSGGRSATTGSPAVRSPRGRWPCSRARCYRPGRPWPAGGPRKTASAAGRVTGDPGVRSTGGDCFQCPSTAGVRRFRDTRQARGRWRIGRLPVRPVLKHGPRSLTCARVSGCYET